MRCHRHLSPATGAALPNSPGQLFDGISLPGIPLCHIAVGRSHYLAIKSVTRGAVTPLCQRFPIFSLGATFGGWHPGPGPRYNLNHGRREYRHYGNNDRAKNAAFPAQDSLYLNVGTPILLFYFIIFFFFVLCFGWMFDMVSRCYL